MSKKTYIYNPPTGICTNCLNKYHKGCSDVNCPCRAKYAHDDSTWQLTRQQYTRATHPDRKAKKINPQRKLDKKIKSMCEDLWRFIVRNRAHWQCEMAGKDGISCSKGRPRDIMQGAHLITRAASLTLKFDTRNGRCLCSGHHVYYTHKPSLWEDICNKYFQPDWDALRELKWQKTPKDFDLLETLKRLSFEASQFKKEN